MTARSLRAWVSQPRMSPTLLRWILACALLAVSNWACALATCTFSSLSLNPAAPSRIVVDSSVPADQVIFSTVISANFSCSGGSSSDYITFATPAAPGTGSGDPVQGVTNVSVVASINQTPAGAHYGLLTGLTGACTLSKYGFANRPVLSLTGSGTCSGRVALGMAFYATNTGGVSGTLPAAMQASYPFPGWLIALQCGGAACNNYTTSLGAINGPTIPITTLASTCSLTTPSSMAVTLPNVSKTSFKGVGSVAGGTPLTIRYNCSTGGGAMALSMAWMFDADTQSTSGYALLNNTGSATGVAVQIIDSTGTAIITGVQSKQITSVASGANTLKYTVRYYQTSATVVPGSVAATAYFTATYN